MQRTALLVGIATLLMVIPSMAALKEGGPVVVGLAAGAAATALVVIASGATASEAIVSAVAA